MELKKLGSIGLAALLAVSLTACGSKSTDAPAPEAPAETASAFASLPQQAPEASVEEAVPVTTGAESYQCDGLVLNVPAAVRDLVVVETSEGDSLFSAREKASVEQAAGDGESREAGWGWLFDLQRIDRQRFQELQRGDLSGVEPFARDEQDRYYVLAYPTDVRIYRAGMEELDPGDETFTSWTQANEWAFDVAEQFTADNGLEPVQVSNTEADIFLANLAYDENARVELVSSRGSYDVSGTDALKEAVQHLTAERSFEQEVRETAPKGESLTVKLSTQLAEELRMDVFAADPTLIRVSYGDDVEYGSYFRAGYADGTRPYDVVEACCAQAAKN